MAQLGARFHGMEEVVSSNLTRSTKLNSNKTKTYNFGMSASMLRERSPESVWSPIVDSGGCTRLIIADEVSATDAATPAVSASLLLGSVCRRGSQFLLCAPEQRVSGIIRRRCASGAAGLTGICDPQ